MRPRNLATPAILTGLLAGTLTGGTGPVDVRAQTAPRYKAVPADMNRFVLSRDRGTIAPGARAEIAIGLQSQSGEQIPAPADLATTITVTSLGSLALAKAEVKAQSATTGTRSLDKQALTLSAKSTTAQLRGLFPRGAHGIEVEVTVEQAGLIRIFVEADGVISGSTVVVVGRPQPGALPDGDEGPQLMLASFQPQPGGRFRLKIADTGDFPLRVNREFVQRFWVTLEWANGRLATLSKNLEVQLVLTKGRGSFANRLVRIPAGESIAEQPAELRTRQGGVVALIARTASESVADSDQFPYTFDVPPHATKLEISRSTQSALANGLDPIKLTIRAVNQQPDVTRVMTAGQEEMTEGRLVTFRFENGTCFFPDKVTQLKIPPADRLAEISLYCARPAGALRVVAEAENGLDQTITGDTTVAFQLPWMQLLLAVLGAMVFPMIYKQDRTRLLVGAVVGLVIYSAFFFGAVATGEFGLGAVLITATKLPTENVLASFVLGILAYLAVGKMLPDKPATTG